MVLLIENSELEKKYIRTILCFKLLISYLSKERRRFEICFKLLFSYREKISVTSKMFYIFVPPVAYVASRLWNDLELKL